MKNHQPLVKKSQNGDLYRVMGQAFMRDNGKYKFGKFYRIKGKGIVEGKGVLIDCKDGRL